ncbi:hypothetical protein AEQU1_00099 [Aequorivita sp. CIP111184]|nr:hypothetical protein AEQU1_00099 [Aequorivita sp. CIP111184]
MLGFLKFQSYLKGFQYIAELGEEERKYILYTLDALIKNVKLKSIA